MSKRTDNPPKKPSGGRPLPKRLFSFESLRKERSGTDSDSQSVDGDRNDLTTLRLVENVIPEGGEDSPQGDAWTESGLVTSPGAISSTSPQEYPRPEDLDDVRSVLSAADDGGRPPPSPSKRRWATLRSHVLPSVSSVASDVPSLPTAHREITSPTGLPGVPARPSTPQSRGYRFGQRKAMRQVVDEVRAGHEVRKFLDDIRKACWTVRFGEVPIKSRVDRDNTQNTVGSSLHLPFMSSTSVVPASSNSSATSLPATSKVPGLRRPPSVQSLTLAGHTVASVTQIARALTSTTSSNRPRVLPLQSLILSALLVPFISPRDGTNAEGEQAIAVETFEYTVRSWKSPTGEVRLSS